MFVDQVKVHIKAGKGGDGLVSCLLYTSDAADD